MPTINTGISNIHKPVLPAAAMAVLALLFIISITPGASAFDCIDCGSNLYLSGSSGLGPEPPAGASDSTATIPISVGVRNVQVGVWRSRPLLANMSVSGEVEFELWARGTGLQHGTQFTLYIGLNDAMPAESFATAQNALNGNPKRFTASGSINLEIAEGDTLTLWVYAHQTGTPGELLFGSSAHPSHVFLPIEPIYISQMTYHEAGKYVDIESTIWDTWGVEDINKTTITVIGPFESRNFEIDVLDVPADKIVSRAKNGDYIVDEVEDSYQKVTWRWEYGREGASPGVYYILTMVIDSGGRIFYDDSLAVVPQPPPGMFEGPAGIVIAAMIIGAIAALAYFYALRTGRIKTQRARTLATGGTVFIVVAAGLFAFVSLIPVSKSGAGEEAPDFTVTAIDGGQFRLSQQRGKVVVLNLFATWCPGCNQEMPELVLFHKKYPDAVMINIDVDTAETEDQLREFRDKYRANWAFAFDSGEVWLKYQEPYNPYIPTTVIINPEGRIAKRVVGETTAKELADDYKDAVSGGVDVSIITASGSLYVMAFLTGALSFFAPCAFPLLPGYISYYIGRSETGIDKPGSVKATKRAVIGGIMAALGIISIFAFLGVIVALVGGGISSYVVYLAPVITVIIALMGLVMLFGIRGPFQRLQSLLSPVTSKVEQGISKAFKGAEPASSTGLYAYGLAYGGAVMGCQAPVFIALMVWAFVSGGFTSALGVFLLFGVGMGLIMIVVTILVGAAKGVIIHKLREAMPAITKVCGLILLVAGIYLTAYYISAMF